MEQWVDEMQRTLHTGEDFAAQGLIPAAEIATTDAVRAIFAAKAPPAYLAAVRTNDTTDPIWRTVVPTADELTVLPDEWYDPIGDEPHTPVRGITHRYPDRALLKPTHTCAVYCRFCFRRYAVGDPAQALDRAELAAALDYIRAHDEIWEIILSGGDPLTLGDGKLEMLLGELRAIPHVKVVRFHTRVPVVLPSRVTDTLARLLAPTRTPRTTTYVVLHINHVQEITPAVEEACDTLADRGIPLLNQSVLLRGINDTPDTMEALLRRLVELRVKPYYLHHGDLARGTAHFRTSLAEGQALMRTLHGRVSGLCLPTYMLEIPGGYGKVPVGPQYLALHADGTATVTDPHGMPHPYPPSSEHAE